VSAARHRRPVPAVAIHIALGAALLFFASGSAAAQGDSLRTSPVPGTPVISDSALEARTRSLAVQLRCAVCQGISIQESPSGLAGEMREVVKEMLRAGKTEEEIKAYFVSKYGEWILLEPKPRGFNLLFLYVFPTLVLLGGLAGIGVLVRRWSAAPAPPAA